MRISDWSSDVCFSDLEIPVGRLEQRFGQRAIRPAIGTLLTERHFEAVDRLAPGRGHEPRRHRQVAAARIPFDVPAILLDLVIGLRAAAQDIIVRGHYLRVVRRIGLGWASQALHDASASGRVGVVTDDLYAW